MLSWLEGSAAVTPSTMFVAAGLAVLAAWVAAPLVGQLRIGCRQWQGREGRPRP